MVRRRIVSGLAIVSGLVVGAVGAWAVGLYLWGVVDVLDQPDRSWIFWGAIFLLAGVCSPEFRHSVRRLRLSSFGSVAAERSGQLLIHRLGWSKKRDLQ